MATGSDSKGKTGRKPVDRKTVRRSRKAERKRRADPPRKRSRRTGVEPASSPPRTALGRRVADRASPPGTVRRPGPGTARQADPAADDDNGKPRHRYAWEPPADPLPTRDPPKPPGKLRPCSTHTRRHDSDQAGTDPPGDDDDGLPAPEHPSAIRPSKRDQTDPNAWLPDWDTASALPDPDDDPMGIHEPPGGLRRIPLRPPRPPG